MERELFQKRLKKAQIIANLLSIVPFVRMIGLNGSMTKGTMREDSDIDFLIIAKHGRIWTARFLVTILTHLTGQRRYGDKIAGRICLNHYLADQYPEILFQDQILAGNVCGLTPLFDSGCYELFQKVNRWIQKFGFKIKPGLKINPKKVKILLEFQKISEMILSGRIGDLFEKILRNYQSKRILRDKRTYEVPKGRIRISDWELCFHPRK